MREWGFCSGFCKSSFSQTDCGILDPGRHISCEFRLLLALEFHKEIFMLVRSFSLYLLVFFPVIRISGTPGGLKYSSL